MARGRRSCRRQLVGGVGAVIPTSIARLGRDGSWLGSPAGSSELVRFRRYERETPHAFEGDLKIEIRPIQTVGMELQYIFELY